MITKHFIGNHQFSRSGGFEHFDPVRNNIAVKSQTFSSQNIIGVRTGVYCTVLSVLLQGGEVEQCSAPKRSKNTEKGKNRQSVYHFVLRALTRIFLKKLKQRKRNKMFQLTSLQRKKKFCVQFFLKKKTKLPVPKVPLFSKQQGFTWKLRKPENRQKTATPCFVLFFQKKLDTKKFFPFGE